MRGKAGAPPLVQARRLLRAGAAPRARGRKWETRSDQSSSSRSETNLGFEVCAVDTYALERKASNGPGPAMAQGQRRAPKRAAFLQSAIPHVQMRRRRPTACRT